MKLKRIFRKLAAVNNHGIFPLSVTLLTSMLAVSVGHAALSTGTILTMTKGTNTTCPSLANDNLPPPASGGGSCFSMETSSPYQLYTKISDTNNGVATITANGNGVIIGAKQTASGTSHTGAPNGTELTAVDKPWSFFGNTGMHQMTTEPTVITADTVLNFSGWNVTWNAIASIPMNARAHSGYTDGQAQITCTPTPCVNGSTYTLGYTATVPDGDPSGFGGVKYGLRLDGSVVVPAALTTDATSLGVGTVATAASSTDGRISETNLTSSGISLDADSSTVNYRVRLFYDFTVNIGGSPGGNARVVIPLSAKLPASPIFRIYKTSTSSWSTFATDGTNNIVSSAAGSLGTCPAVGDAAYVSPATAGHYCLQLTIQDNGVNDNNSTLGAIASRGGVASGATVDALADTRSDSTGGCSLTASSTDLWSRGEWWLLLSFIAWLGMVAYRRQKQA